MEVTVNIDLEEIRKSIEKKIREDLERMYSPNGSMIFYDLEKKITSNIVEKLSEEYYKAHASSLIAKMDYQTILNSSQILVGKHIRDSFKG
jgi:hypothetical protein